MRNKTCIHCGETLRTQDDDSDCCYDCWDGRRVDVHDMDNEEFDSVEDWIQQTMNEELGLD